MSQPTGDRTAEQMRRLGQRRMNTAIILVAGVYGVVTLCVVAGVVAVAVYAIRMIFF